MEKLLQPSQKISRTHSDEDEWYYFGPNKSSRCRFSFCGDCCFKAINRSDLLIHVKRYHPTSITAFPPKRKYSRSPLPTLKCSFDHCSFQTKLKFKLKKHKMLHGEKLHRCSICSYSTKTAKLLDIHMRRDHHARRNEVSEEKGSGTSSISSSDVDDNTASSFQQNIQQQRMKDSRAREAKCLDFISNRQPRFQFCRDCDYKSIRRPRLIAHVNRKHPSSKTALPPPLKKRNNRRSTLLHCSHHCEFQTKETAKLEWHESHHMKKSTYECIFCTYSVKTAEYLRFHLKRDHPESQVGEIPSVSELSFIATKEEFHYSSCSKKRKYINCGDCDFRTYARSILMNHVKNLHTESTTALPPLLSRKVLTPDFLRCSYCNNRATPPSSLIYHKRLHRKKSDHQCPLCSYSVSNLKHLDHHLNHDHNEQRSNENSSNDTSIEILTDDGETAALLEENSSSAATCGKFCNRFEIERYQDSEASALPAMSTASKTSVNDDKVFIQNNATSTLDWISSEVEVVWENATDKDLPKQTASRDCFVKLHDISDLLAEAILQDKSDEKLYSKDLKTRLQMKKEYKCERNSCLQIIGTKVAVSIEYHQAEQQSRSETEKKVKMMLSRIAFMVEKARTVNQEVTKIKLKKDDCRRKINETTRTKTQAEIDLRIQQCEVLEFKIFLMDYSEGYEDDLASVEGLTLKYECDVEELSFKLKALQKDKADLAEDLEDMERSYCGIMEVVNALKLELNFLKSSMCLS